MDINNTLDELTKFWFDNPQLWFNCSIEDDKLITKKYSSLLLNNNDVPCLGTIILYDQIPRHIYRNSDQEKIDYYLKIALEHCKNILPIIETYKPEERCFILLPLRHTFIEGNIKKCLSYINKWIEEDTESIYNRFYQASITSLSKINSSKNTKYKIYKFTDYTSILDSISTKDINFVHDNNIYHERIYQEFSKNINNTNSNIIISISGGVDSMVCSFLLYYYCHVNKNHTPYGATINYANRSEQYLEVEMVNQWLQLLNIEHHIRVIEEIKRERDKNRDFYEKITRDIRFELYKKLNGSVILGHNKDDSLENIFSNIKKKKSYDNLLGMSINSVEKNIEISRPLLNISKSEIIEFAKKYNIPFVYDSTPSWSERGQMRDVLIPQINEFDKDILEGLIEMSKNFKEIYSVYKKNVIPDIRFEEDCCSFENQSIYTMDYWKNILGSICEYYKCNNIKNKSIINLIENISTGNKITLSKNIVCQMKKNNIIFNIIF